jgi:non-homologous end joining protein Ku
MHILYYMGEIKDIERLPELERLVVVSKEELKLAEALVERLTKETFEPGKFKDVYTESLKKLIKAKAEGKEFRMAEERVEAARGLMEALKASVKAAKKKKKAA